MYHVDWNEPIGDALRAAVVFGLPGHERPGTPPRLDERQLERAAAHRVQGLVATALTAGAVTAPTELVEAAHRAHAAALHRCLVVEEVAIEAVGVLVDEGVEARVLKGVALAHLDYHEPSERVFADVDLLVRRADLARSLAGLHSLGYQRLRPAVGDGWERRFAKSVTLSTPHGVSLDLHLSIAPGYFGVVANRVDALARPAEPFELAGRSLSSLDHEYRLLSVCCHLVLGGGAGLRAARDVAQLALARPGSSMDVARRSVDLGLAPVVAEAVTLTWLMLGLDAHHPLAAWAREYEPSASEARALASYRRSVETDWSGQALGTLAALGWADKARFVWGLAVPSRASLAARGRSRSGHIRQLLRGVARR